MNAKAFVTNALTSALELGLATPEDIVRHVTPEVLAAHLPRPLWARLLTACVGAPRVDAELLIETVGVANLGEHLPSSILWTCIAEVSARALGGTYVAPPRTDYARSAPPVAMGTPSPPVAAVKPLSIDSPPPPEPPKPSRPAPVNPGPSIPSPGSQSLAEIAADIDAEAAAATPAPSRTRSATNRFRPTSTNIGRLAATRRPQASVPTAPEPTMETAIEPTASPPAAQPADARRVRRGETEAELEVETAVGSGDDWEKRLAVEDENLVDWAAAEETRSSDDSRKR